MAQLQAELNEIFTRLDNLEKRLSAIHPADPYAHLSEDDLVQQMYYGKSYTADQVKSPDEQKMSIEKFKQAFGKRVADDLTLCGPLPKEEKKEESHPAANSSFVLKI